MNRSFRTVFLFQEEPFLDFIFKFIIRKPRMLQALQDLEDKAVQLDEMNKEAKIFSVFGSSVGAAGGVCSIIGLALSPVTAGASLALTAAGMGMGIASGVTSAATTVKEIGVNRKHQKKAGEVLQSLMEDVQSLQDCLGGVTKRALSQIDDDAEGVLKVSRALRRSLNRLVDFSSGVAASAGIVVVQEGKAWWNLAADIPDIGQAAVKGPLALTKSARAGLIGLNALFLGMDVYFICKDSISLAKGCETEVSQFIRARAALWSSEIDSWQKIYDYLCEGLLTSEENKTVLERPFYPERREMKKLKRNRNRNRHRNSV